MKRKFGSNKFGSGHRPLRGSSQRVASGRERSDKRGDMAERLRAQGASEAVISKIFPSGVAESDKKKRTQNISVRLGSEL